MQVRVGTSGFSYKEWKGSFYPEDLKSAGMLAYYAERFSSVEINNTFYRMPKASVLEGWAEQVPSDFLFVLKASQQITHRKRLRDAGEPLAYLMETASTLRDRLGPVLFQLPPSLRKDLPRLREFLSLLPPGRPFAFEFRHPSWSDEEIHSALREGNHALVCADTEDSAGGGAPIVPTADWGYLRLRRCDYTEDELHPWVDRILSQPWDRAFVFFKHEDDRPLAWDTIRRFRDALG
jgi:uncharacterized protein YecE (DUF72 family)